MTNTLKFFRSFDESLFAKERPTKNAYLHWTDSEKIQKQKNDYYEKSEATPWNPISEFGRFARQNVFILVWTALNFLQECFTFQKNLFWDRPQQLLLHPFSHQSLTISSYSYKLLQIFSLNFHNLYSSSTSIKSYSDRVSRSEYEFCCFMIWKFPQHNFQHAFNNVTGQKKIKNYSIDLYSPVTEEAYFFQGCWFHSHSLADCLDEKRKNTVKNSFRTFEEARARENDMIKVLLSKTENQVKTVKFIFECEWNVFKKTEEYRTFAKANKSLLKRPLQRLEPSVANRGGLLEIFNLHWSAEKFPNEQFNFIDLNAIYPYVSMKNSFCVGKPIIIIGESLKFINIRNNTLYFDNHVIKQGLIFCEMMAPPNLKYPFLQYRLKNNMGVALSVCRSCAENSKTKCLHRSPDSKSFISTWTIAEINYSLSLLYKLKAVFEVHIFEQTDFILKDYVQKLSSLKFKSSWDRSLPAHEYCNKINNFLNLDDNFKLVPTDIHYNEMRQTIYKIQLNSSFGKFSENTSNNKTTLIIKSQKELEEKSRYRNISSIEQLNDFTVLLTIDDPPRHGKRNSNVYIGAHISAFARIYFYDKLKKLTDLNYTPYSMDTDSICFSAPLNSKPIFEFSQLLGDFKNVLGPTSVITHFYSLGQRNYCIVYENNKNEIEVLIKCKGLCLKSFFSKEILTASVYHDFISSYFNNEFRNFKITQQRFRQKSQITPKIAVTEKYSFSNKINIKRIIFNDGSTVPYGFCDKK